MRQMKLHHYLWAVAAACMLLPGCSNEDLSDHAAAPVFIPGNSEVEIRFAAHSDEVSTSVDKRTTVDEDGNLDEMGVFCLVGNSRRTTAHLIFRGSTLQTTTLLA